MEYPNYIIDEIIKKLHGKDKKDATSILTKNNQKATKTILYY